MKIIGVTGTFGSGKSEAARILARTGAYLIDHDLINHKILEKDRAGYRALIREYGVGVLDRTNELDRKKVAQIAFSSPDNVKRIQDILHPIIIKVEQELVERYKREGKYDFIVFDTPLLFESGRDAVCDYTVVVTADEETIFDRIEKKLGIERKEAQKRISLQMSLEEKASIADFVIENSGTLAELEEKIIELFNKIKHGIEAGY